MGELIEWYIPAPKPPIVPVEAPIEDGQVPAAGLLKTLLEKADKISDILVLMCDVDGNLGFIGNLDGLAESMLFIDRVKHRALAADANPEQTPPPKRVS